MLFINLISSKPVKEQMRLNNASERTDDINISIDRDIKPLGQLIRLLIDHALYPAMPPENNILSVFSLNDLKFKLIDLFFKFNTKNMQVTRLTKTVATTSP